MVTSHCFQTFQHSEKCCTKFETWVLLATCEKMFSPCVKNKSPAHTLTHAKTCPQQIFTLWCNKKMLSWKNDNSSNHTPICSSQSYLIWWHGLKLQLPTTDYGLGRYNGYDALPTRIYSSEYIGTDYQLDFIVLNILVRITNSILFSSIYLHGLPTRFYSAQWICTDYDLDFIQLNIFVRITNSILFSCIYLYGLRPRFYCREYINTDYDLDFIVLNILGRITNSILLSCIY